MVRIRSQNELIQSLIDFFRTAQPRLDTKPGSVARDLVIDAPSTQVARIYEEIAAVSNLQSIRLASGADLDRLGQNYAVIRQRGSRSTGPVLLTFNSLEADIEINKGDVVIAKNGVSFQVKNSVNVSPVFANAFRATAARFRADLDYVRITDEFAVEVLVEAVSPGIAGNVSKYAINRTSIPNINHVTNVTPFSGGRDTEDDATYRNRIFAVFSGANTGTAVGYDNAARSDPSVIDVVVIQPGSVLMTRDGTQVSESEDGTKTIISEGTGGKIDIYVLGTRLQETVNSFIFRDSSNTGDVTDEANNFVLGQIVGDENKTISRRRLENIENETLPNQPVSNVIQVSGSLSGANFVEKSVDSLGRVTGNYEIIEDTGAFGGSPFGRDALSWISDRVSDLEEAKTKQSFNGQDPLGFTDVLRISGVVQNISVVNENSRVSASDRSSLQLSHFPVTNVTRVFNVTTGERYVVSDQNPDGDGSVNETGRITIRGQSLPSTSDILQVDYTWVFNYDPNWDFDDKDRSNNPREVGDSIDWGFSNAVRRERATLTASGSILNVTVTHPISSVIDVNVFSEETGSLSFSSGRVAFITSSDVSNVVSIVRDSDGAELWNTSAQDGSFSGQTIFLPTDTLGDFGDEVTVVYNAIDVFEGDTPGNFSGNEITITPSSDAVAGELVEVNYIANISTLLPSTSLSDLPAIRSGNKFDTNSSTDIGVQPTTHLFDSDGSTILSNLRQAPSVVGLNVVGSISPGVLTVSGTTVEGVFERVFTATTDGLKQNLSNAVKEALGLSSNQPIPSGIRVGRVSKMERVSTTSGLEVLEVLHTFDLKGYKLLDNNFVKRESVQDSSLSATEVELPATPDNLENEPQVGDRFRATFYIINYDDSEDVSFSRSGQLFTNKVFALVDTVSISSGFLSTTSSSATLSLTNQNQPTTRSRYRAIYDYTAPKENERISIRYNYNKLISDVTFEVENTRPISADVLVKESPSIEVDVTMNIVVTEAFVNNSETVRQNVQDAITAVLNTDSLGRIVDGSDLVSAAHSVEGVDRARVLFFNRSEESGSVLSIEAEENEYIVASTVTVVVEQR